MDGETTEASSAVPPPPPVRLRPPQHRLDRRVVVLWVGQAAFGHVPRVVVATLAFALWEAARPWLVVAVALSIVLAFVGIVVEPWWRYAVHRWEVTDEAVYALSGWWAREWRVAPISRIQTVDTVRGPFEQLLGLSTLRITTASSRGAIVILGVDHELAAAVAERLTTITARTPGDAT